MNYSPFTLWSLDTLFPRYCVYCHKPDADICTDCWHNIVLIEKQSCMRCHKIMPGGRTCASCRKYSTLYQVVAAAHYADGPLREALHTLKYHARSGLINPLRDLVTANSSVMDVLNALDATQTSMMPVPLHRKRLWWRGFNQSSLLARAIASQVHLPVVENVLIRQMYTVPQATLRKKERSENPLNSFTTLKPEVVQDKTIVLIDDIVTTGATLNACAKALKQAGARRVIGLVIAQAT